MKRFLTALALSLACVVSFGATTAPVQLLNPSGSTAGQAILSTGPASAPAWGTVTLGGVSGTLAVANGGTGAASLAAHGVIVGEGTAAVTAIGPGTNGQMLLGVTSADPYWGNNPAISGGTVDNSPIGNTTASTGKFTTLSATGAVSGAGFTSLLSPYATLASPTFTGTPAAPTATAGTNTTQLATTAFVTSAVSTAIPTGWTSYTPTITAASGSFTTTSATGAYYKIGNLVFVRVKITITTVGTGTNPVFSLPFTANSSGDRVILAGTETALTGKMLQSRVDQSATTSTVYFYDSTSPSANGAVCVISGVYISN